MVKARAYSINACIFNTYFLQNYLMESEGDYRYTSRPPLCIRDAFAFKFSLARNGDWGEPRAG